MSSSVPVSQDWFGYLGSLPLAFSHTAYCLFWLVHSPPCTPALPVPTLGLTCFYPHPLASSVLCQPRASAPFFLKSPMVRVLKNFHWCGAQSKQFPSQAVLGTSITWGRKGAASAPGRASPKRWSFCPTSFLAQLPSPGSCPVLFSHSPAVAGNGMVVPSPAPAWT